MPKSKHDPGAVDAYLAGLPEAERASLEDLRELIKSTVPDVQERISYGTSVIFALEREIWSASWPNRSTCRSSR
jgi:uncharacterized protein YdhG (YjbR/CyaY superfamily)